MVEYPSWWTFWIPAANVFLVKRRTDVLNFMTIGQPGWGAWPFQNVHFQLQVIVPPPGQSVSFRKCQISTARHIIQPSFIKNSLISQSEISRVTNIQTCYRTETEPISSWGTVIRTTSEFPPRYEVLPCCEPEILVIQVNCYIAAAFCTHHV